MPLLLAVPYFSERERRRAPPVASLGDGSDRDAGTPARTASCRRVLHDTTHPLGIDPGLEKDGVEAELQELLAARVAVLRTDMALIRREYPTDIGPVDLLCSDDDGRTVVVEVKRIGEIASVEQLLRYQERLDRDPRFAPTLGMLVAQSIKPQAKVFAESKGVTWIEVDLDELRGGVETLKLF